MGDFVRNLIDRTVGRSEALEPTIAPIFAYGSDLTIGGSKAPILDDLDSDPGSDTLIAPWSEPALSTSDNARGRSLGLRGVVPDESMREGGSEPGQSGLLVKPDDRRTLSTRFEPISDSEDAGGVLSPVTTESSKHALDSVRTMPEQPDSPRVEAITPGRLPGGTAEAPDLPGAPPVLPARQAASRLSAPEKQPGGTSPDRMTRLSPVQTVRPRVSVIQESPPQKDTAASAFEGAAASEPPVVRVTIGRIDVRAVRPHGVPTPQRKAARKPRLSLEDYLKQRDRGER